MNWPMSHEFNEAIQNAKLVFSDPDLRAGEVVVGARGLPLPRSGNFADVYQLRGADGRDWAVKCFTRPVTGLGDRYAAISESLAQASLPFTVGFSYLAEGIRIGGAWWPVVKMEWVEGLLLNQVTRENASRPAILAALGQMWGRLSRRLRESRVAHADLQHGNVLMVPGSRPGAYGLKLIDYDGMYVPALANQPSGESGHPAYQHPGRSGPGGYSPDVDRFPHLLIASVLKGLEVGGTALWERYDTGDNLLFVESDFKNPAASKLMRELWQTEHPGVQALVGRLALASQRPIPQTPWLDQIAPEGEPTPLDEETRREAIRTLGLPIPVPIPVPIPIPLPPEPAPEPMSWGDVVESPSSKLIPTPVASPKKATSPTKKIDVEVVEESTRGKGPKGKPKYQEEQKSSSTRLLVIGGVLLLLSVVAVGVVLSGGKPKPIADIGSEDPNPPGPKESGLKDRNQKGGVPKGDNPEPGTPNPKDKNSDPIDPIQQIATPIIPDASRGSIKELSRIPLGQVTPYAARFDHDGQHLIVLGHPQHLISYDPQTKEARSLPDVSKGSVPGSPQLFVVGNHVATWRPGANSLAVSDLTTGLATGTINFPDLPLPINVENDAIIAISPDKRYVAAGRRSPYKTRPGSTENISLPVPFQLLDTTTGQVIQSFDWASGFVHFNADSSRVLVIESSGRGRWFKLPSGELDGEWKFGEQTAEMPPLVVDAVSQDGNSVLCFGTVGGQPTSHFLLDGRTGRVLFVLGQGFMATSGCLSADGRIAAILQWKAFSLETWMVIYDTARRAEVARVKVPDKIVAAPLLALSPDGRRVMVLPRQPFAEAIVYDVVVGAKDPPAEMILIKELKRIPLGQPPHFAAAINDDGERLVVMNQPQSLVSYDTRTGEVHPLPNFPRGDGRGGIHLFIVGTRVVVWHSGENSLAVSDLTTGLAAGTITFPDLPLPAGVDNDAIIAISPDKRYVAAGRRSPRTSPLANKEKIYLPVPFQLLDTTARKTLLTFDWTSGVTHFTADSSRLLVIEGSGRGRWFKLPSGEPDGEWKFGEQLAGMSLMVVNAVSQDGNSVLCFGTVGGQPASHFLLDGRTGRVSSVLGQGFHSTSGCLSADGQFAALLQQKASPWETWMVVFDTARGAEVARVKINNTTNASQILTLSSDGRRAAAVSRLPNGEAIIYDLVRTKEPDEVVLKPKEPSPPSEPTNLKPQWTAAVATSPVSLSYLDPGTNLLVLGSNEGAVALDVRTGVPRKEFTALTASKAHALFPLEHGRFGTLAFKRDDFEIWDTKTGKLSERLTVPSVPAGPANAASVYVALSRNQKYVAIGRIGMPSTDYPDLPFRVIEPATRKVLVSVDWRGGSAHFTADSSRVLIAEWTGKARWFKLPSGEPDGGWDFGPPQAGRINIVHAISANGSSVAYTGPGIVKAGGALMGIIDGKTGRPIRPFTKDYHDGSMIALSEDGRRAAVLRAFQPDGDAFVRTIDVVDVPTGLVFNHARIESGKSLPTFDLTPDGKALVVHDATARKAYFFDSHTP